MAGEWAQDEIRKVARKAFSEDSRFYLQFEKIPLVLLWRIGHRAKR